MTFTCPLCRKEWILYKNVCLKCDKIRHLMEIYSRDKVIDILEKVLVVEQFKEKKEEHDPVNTKEPVAYNSCHGDDSADYDGPKTRSKKLLIKDNKKI